MDAYAAVYVDRGEHLDSGPRSIPHQLEFIRRIAAPRGQTIEFIGIDIIVDNPHRVDIDALVAEAHRLARAALADSTSEVEYYIVALTPEAPGEDPRDAPDSARSRVAGIAARGRRAAGQSNPPLPMPVVAGDPRAERVPFRDLVDAYAAAHRLPKRAVFNRVAKATGQSLSDVVDRYYERNQGYVWSTKADPPTSERSH
jgi:hypothetical protein